ncbi:MAG: hypothetical protein HY457_01910 [Parcubacteria group bacterium]|nr:hypothetical protein [Parcubacteria group bacterium]
MSSPSRRIIGVALLLFIPVAVFAAGLVPCGGVSESGVAEPQCNFDFFVLLIQTVINTILTVIAMPVAALSFAYAGYLYLTSAGNESKTKQAIAIFTTVAYGIVFALAAWLAVNLAVNTLLRPGFSLLGS